VETLTARSEPKGKLDTMATQPATMLAADAVVNGPEDEPLDWHAIDWRAVEEDVRRLRQRICTGLLEPDARKACKSGSEGGRAQQCARPTRRRRPRSRARCLKLDNRQLDARAI
jgi:hypothetical protein